MTRLVITTALMAEAVPVIDACRLQKQVAQPGLKLFRGADLDLLVCGMGAVRMRQGLNTYFCSPGAREVPNWLNLGIAGSRSNAIGDLIWADHIGEQQIGLPESANTRHPFRVQSLHQPSIEYRAGVLFDMEAEEWLKCVAENIQQYKPERLFCAKVISDNSSSGLPDMDKNWVSDLIRKNIISLIECINNIIKT